jgi:hypothetical protein
MDRQRDWLDVSNLQCSLGRSTATARRLNLEPVRRSQVLAEGAAEPVRPPLGRSALLGRGVDGEAVAHPVRRLQSVPERLDRVAIATSRDVIELSWASRDSLLHEIRNLGENAKPIRAAFEAVGASRPVELSHAEQTTLFSAIEIWADSVTVEALPPGIWRLRCALADQVDGADQRTR